MNSYRVVKLFKSFALYTFLCTLLMGLFACSDSSDVSNTPIGSNNDAETIQAPPLNFRDSMAFSDAIDLSGLVDQVTSQHYLAPARAEVQKHLQSRTEFERYLTTLDAYSKYVDAEKVQYTRQRRTLPRNGIGLDIIESNGKLLALPIKDGALYRAGLTTAHYLNAINGKSLRFNDFASYRFLATMQRNEKYTVDVISNPFSTGKIYEARVEQTRRPLYTTQKQGNRVVLGIKEFSSGIQDYLQNFFAQQQNMSHLVLDLRHCIGGNPYATIDALNYFVPTGKKVASYRSDATRKDQEFFTSSVRNGLKASTKVTVLVSEFTVSSTELFIHALKHYRPKITIIGKPTAGKCLAQKAFPLDNGDVLILSVYDLLPPSGVSCESLPINVDQQVNDIELMPLQHILQTIL